MAHAIRFEKAGGPEVLSWQTIEVGKPGQGQVRLRHTAVGLNYVDTYQRSGLYPMPMPSGLGSEAAGVIEEVGAGVSGLKPGDRVAYSGGPIGAYADERVMPADRLVPLPGGITDQQAAAMMLKGMTAWYLVRRTHPVKRGETILIHAAAGGVGLIVCQWAKHLGATVIGTVGDEKKAALAKQNGCDHPILYKHEDFVAKVSELTQGKKLPVVYDSVGKDTFYKSL
ncbi:MAG TPA: quinone oxidoreductase, partial [Stellaceae bacterium]|nr:quinone oxidoreductase [Stellaceae bacterium]